MLEPGYSPGFVAQLEQQKRKEASLSAEQLRQNLHYDPGTGVFTWNKKKGHGGTRAGIVRPDGYRRVRLGGRDFRAARLAWLYVYGKWPVGVIDHIDRVRDNDRIANLRDVTFSGNQWNRTISKTNKSGINGVHWDSKIERWCAYVAIKGKGKNLGAFETIEAAAAARAEGERLYYGRPES